MYVRGISIPELPGSCEGTQHKDLCSGLLSNAGQVFSGPCLALAYARGLISGPILQVFAALEPPRFHIVHIYTRGRQMHESLFILGTGAFSKKRNNPKDLNAIGIRFRGCMSAMDKNSGVHICTRGRQMHES